MSKAENLPPACALRFLDESTIELREEYLYGKMKMSEMFFTTQWRVLELAKLYGIDWIKSMYYMLKDRDKYRVHNIHASGILVIGKIADYDVAYEEYDLDEKAQVVRVHYKHRTVAYKDAINIDDENWRTFVQNIILESDSIPLDCQLKLQQKVLERV